MLQDYLYYSGGKRKKRHTTPPPKKKEKKKKNPQEQLIIAKIFLSKTQYSKGTHGTLSNESSEASYGISL